MFNNPFKRKYISKNKDLSKKIWNRRSDNCRT